MIARGTIEESVRTLLQLKLGIYYGVIIFIFTSKVLKWLVVYIGLWFHRNSWGYSWFLEGLVHWMEKLSLSIDALWTWIIQLIVLENGWWLWLSMSVFIHCIIVVVWRSIWDFKGTEVELPLWWILEAAIDIGDLWFRNDISFCITVLRLKTPR